ncbi:MAG: phage head morphogenesis protein [Burkholderiaceae bacterium]|nr:phage head morphogenesis protein [Burkholderiaceae bacterium]
MADTPAAPEFRQRPKFNAPFPEQVDFFRKKLNLPTERWDDILRSAHDRAFIVAGAQSADLLADLHQAVSKAIKDGTGLEAFRKDFKNIVAKNGWTDFTGSGSKAGIAWRTKVIYQTNLATSYAAGRWQQLNNPDLLKTLPYWRYKHNDSVFSPRPLHVSWDGLTLAAGHAFWKTHFPPNGWGCQCRVVPVNKTEFMQAVVNGRGPANAPAPGDTTGIDDGFDYAPGANADKPLKEFIDKKLINLEAPIGAQMWEKLQPVLKAEQAAVWKNMVERVVKTKQARQETQLAYVVAPATVQDLTASGVQLSNAAVWLRDDELLHALRDTKEARKATLPLSIWRDLPATLEKATPYLDKVDEALVYAFDLADGVGKVVIRVNYREKGRFDGVRERITSNFITTGTVIDAGDLPLSRYLPLKK